MQEQENAEILNSLDDYLSLETDSSQASHQIALLQLHLPDHVHSLRLYRPAILSVRTVKDPPLEEVVLPRKLYDYGVPRNYLDLSLEAQLLIQKR